MAAKTTAEHRRGDLRWYADQGVWQTWTGTRWERARYAAHPTRLKDPRPFGPGDEVAEVARRALLDRAVEQEVLIGRDVRDRRELSCVLGERYPVNHLGHALLTLLTVGLWAIIWLVMLLDRREDRMLFSVDAYGNVWAREP